MQKQAKNRYDWVGETLVFPAGMTEAVSDTSLFAAHSELNSNMCTQSRRLRAYGMPSVQSRSWKEARKTFHRTKGGKKQHRRWVVIDFCVEGKFNIEELGQMRRAGRRGESRREEVQGSRSMKGECREPDTG